MNRLNTRIVAPDVSVPKDLESLDLDFPTGSYDFSRVRICCWAVLGSVGVVLGYFLRLLTLELEFRLNINKWAIKEVIVQPIYTHKVLHIESNFL